MTDSLSAHEVDVGPSSNVPLRPDELPGLQAGLERISAPSKRPVQDALQQGEATVGQRSIALPPAPAATGADGIAERAEQMGVRDTKIETSGNRYAVSARLNPWVRIAEGRLAEIDAASGHNSRARRQNADWTFIRLADHNLVGADLAVGQAWPPVAAAPPAAADMDVDEEAAPPQAPVRDAYAAARDTIEEELGRALTEPEWEAISDFEPADITQAVANAQGTGVGPLHFLAGLDNASCIPTSHRLMALIGSGDTAALPDDDRSVAQRVGTVAAAIGADGAAGIFRLQFGGSDHGFTVVVQNGRAELTQSFAGGDGETLATNLASADFQFTAAQVAEHLRNLSAPGETDDAQQALFGGSIDGGGASPIAAMAFISERRALPADLPGQVTGQLRARAARLGLQ